MYLLAKLANYTDALCKGIVFILFIIMVVVTFTQVIFRFIFFSLSWSEELSRYCLIWLTFIGGALGVRYKIHVAIEAITSLFPSRLKITVSRVNYFLLAIFAGALIKYGWALSAINMRQFSPAIHIPMGIVYAALPVGGLLILLFSLELCVNAVNNGGHAK